MKRNLLLVIAVVLIAIGVAGIFTTAWLGGSYCFGGGMFFGGKMMKMMMGGGMMRQDSMKEMMKEMMGGRLPPDIKPEGLPDSDSRGAKLLERYCTQCHNLPSPAMHTAEEWPSVEARMINRMEMMSKRGRMTGGMMRRGMMDIKTPKNEEQKWILAYLQHHALRPASLETLGPTDTPGLALFRKVCSQCHALPDVKLHTADEWFVVVERMRKNMETMGKPVITDQEKNKIVSYLSQITQ